MRKYLLLLLLASVNCLSAFTQNLSQTKTATYLNNLSNFRQAFGDQNYPRAKASDLAADDNIYGCSSKLRGVKDSGSSSNSFSSLNLQGFGFTIPDGASIENISIRLRRFKTGNPPVGDYFLTLMQRVECGVGTPCRYGVEWTNNDSYAGKIYPSTETEYIFSQTGSGTNGGYFHDQTYQWTPTIVNQTTFGLRIDSYQPVGRGSVQICYDLVEITVEYSQPAIAAKSPAQGKTTTLKTPIAFPNPFTTKTSIQFTAAESGKAVVELYDISGSKVSTLFSGSATKGQTYNVAVGYLRLQKGIYVYRITNGKQKYTGRIIKLE